MIKPSFLLTLQRREDRSITVEIEKRDAATTLTAVNARARLVYDILLFHTKHTKPALFLSFLGGDDQTSTLTSTGWKWSQENAVDATGGQLVNTLPSYLNKLSSLDFQLIRPSLILATRAYVPHLFVF